jgi:hypothetical protein
MVAIVAGCNGCACLLGKLLSDLCDFFVNFVVRFLKSERHKAKGKRLKIHTDFLRSLRTEDCQLPTAN